MLYERQCRSLVFLVTAGSAAACGDILPAESDLAVLTAALAAAGPQGVMTTVQPCAISDELVFVEDVWADAANASAEQPQRWVGYHIVSGGELHINTANASGFAFQFVNCADNDVSLTGEQLDADLPTYTGSTSYPVLLRGQAALLTSTETGVSATRRSLGDYDSWSNGVQFEGVDGAHALYTASTDDAVRPTMTVVLAPDAAAEPR